MDSFEIARLMANQNAANPLRLRFGTVESADEEGALLVVPDGATEAVPVVRCCHPLVGNRVVMLAGTTEWLAVAVVGGDHIDTSRTEALEKQVAALAFDTGWKNVYYIAGSIDIKARRVGNTVTIIGTSTAYYDVGGEMYHDVTRLNEEFRPSCQIPFVINYMGGDPVGQSSYVRPDGLISIYSTGSGKTYWCFNVTYVV